MWLSIRERFTSADPAWAGYKKFIGPGPEREVCTIDPMLNPIISDLGDTDDPRQAVVQASNAQPCRAGCYVQCAINISHLHHEAPPVQFTLLGFDLADETNISSLLNCGPLIGTLEQFTSRMNGHGLLSQQDAVAFLAALTASHPDDPHSQAMIWAIYEARSKDQ